MRACLSVLIAPVATVLLALLTPVVAAPITLRCSWPVTERSNAGEPLAEESAELAEMFDIKTPLLVSLDIAEHKIELLSELDRTILGTGSVKVVGREAVRIEFEPPNLSDSDGKAVLLIIIDRFDLTSHMHLRNSNRARMRHVNWSRTGACETQKISP